MKSFDEPKTGCIDVKSSSSADGYHLPPAYHRQPVQGSKLYGLQKMLSHAYMSNLRPTAVILQDEADSHGRLYFSCPFSSYVWQHLLLKNGIHKPSNRVLHL
ncbi:hypothetical protein RHSIM_Rhsim05G0005900 [Rhododendron simsii]|uniref:Uncharacterized protein n=1 Tax=Rhododendron simsii TaxID=118357 RepID=A0A834GWN7_RHOSS|nr:hypothetical protein RHSIM_Rhsim05G0005900 [Rhododendron simsii]